MPGQDVDKADEGRMPRTIEVEMTHDLVGACRAGDNVTVLGTVKVMNTDMDSGVHDKFSARRYHCVLLKPKLMPPYQSHVKLCALAKPLNLQTMAT